MNVLLISQIFPPEAGAAANRAFAHSKYWAKFGHKVTVICETPCYMIDEVKRYDTRKGSITEKINGIDCIRVPVFQASNKSSIKRRLLNQISFMFGAIRYGRRLLKKQRFDIVIASSPPLFAGIVGKKLARKANAQFIFEVRDLWPESIVAMGKMSNKNPVVMIAKRVANHLYKKADALVTVTKGLKRRLENRISGKEVILIYNGADLSEITSKSKMEKGLLVYSGILGHFQAVDVMVRGLSFVKERDVKCLIVGDGPEMQKLKEETKRLGMEEKVAFTGSVSHKEALEYIGKADVCLVSMIDSPITNEALPSKVFEYAACGKPVVASLAGEMADMIKEYKIGLVSKPGDPVAFAKILNEMLENEEMREEFSENARRFAELFSREKMAKEYLTLMESLSGKDTQEHRTGNYMIK